MTATLPTTPHGISDSVVVMTHQELAEFRHKAYSAGVERGKFENHSGQIEVEDEETRDYRTALVQLQSFAKALQDFPYLNVTLPGTVGYVLRVTDRVLSKYA